MLFACGCAMLIDRAVFVDAGGWDEGTFAYYEDVELGWRLNLLGHAIWFAPGAVVRHKHHGTSGRWAEPPRIRLYERNSLRMVYELLDLPCSPGRCRDAASCRRSGVAQHRVEPRAIAASRCRGSCLTPACRQFRQDRASRGVTKEDARVRRWGALGRPGISGCGAGRAGPRRVRSRPSGVRRADRARRDAAAFDSAVGTAADRGRRESRGSTRFSPSCLR
jgi:hypothetical protein